MIPLPPWLTLRVLKLGACAVLVLGLCAAVLWYRHSLISDGKSQERAVWQAKWGSRETALQKAANEQIQRNIVQEAESRARNEEIANAHAKELAAASADRDRNYRLLQQARQRPTPSSCPAPEGAGIAGTPDPRETGSPESAADIAFRERLDAIDAAVADLIEEARGNASQLDSLIGEIRPQL